MACVLHFRTKCKMQMWNSEPETSVRIHMHCHVIFETSRGSILYFANFSYGAVKNAKEMYEMLNISYIDVPFSTF